MEEFDVVDVDRKRRGARSDEYIEAIQARGPMTRRRRTTASSCRSRPVYIGPKPAREGGPVLSIGGHTEATLVRVARRRRARAQERHAGAEHRSSPTSANAPRRWAATRRASASW